MLRVEVKDLKERFVVDFSKTSYSVCACNKPTNTFVPELNKIKNK